MGAVGGWVGVRGWPPGPSSPGISLPRPPAVVARAMKPRVLITVPATPTIVTAVPTVHRVNATQVVRRLSRRIPTLLGPGQVTLVTVVHAHVLWRLVLAVVRRLRRRRGMWQVRTRPKGPLLTSATFVAERVRGGGGWGLGLGGWGVGGLGFWGWGGRTE